MSHGFRTTTYEALDISVYDVVDGVRRHQSVWGCNGLLGHNMLLVDQPSLYYWLGAWWSGVNSDFTHVELQTCHHGVGGEEGDKLTVKVLKRDKRHHPQESFNLVYTICLEPFN